VRTNRKRVGLSLGGLGFLCVIAFFARAPVEPTYEGRSLSYWTEKLSYDDQFVDGVTFEKLPAFHADVKAIRAIGSNSIPFLLAAIDTRETAVRRIATRLSSKLEKGMRIKSADAQHEEAICAFRVLGDQGAIAVPALTTMLQKHDATHARAPLLALAGIGPAAYPAVRDATNFIFHPLLSADVMELIRSVGRGATAALPALQAAVESTNRNWRLNALSALSRMGTNSAPLLPHALRFLDDPDPGVAGNALNVVNAAHIASPEVREALMRPLQSTNGANHQFIHMTLTNLFSESTL
jgi:hypothetical protein